MNPMWSDLFSFRKKTQPSLVRTIESSILFEGLSPSEVGAVSQLVYERHYQPGETIFRKETRGVGLYLISQGCVSIRAQGDGSTLGPEVARLETGSFFGELALIDPESIRSATAIAQTESTLVGFFKPDLEELLERRPEIGVKILLQLSRVLGTRLMRSTQEIQKLSAQKASAPGGAS
jgi:CRP-like cAMP-binding protein